MGFGTSVYICLLHFEDLGKVLCEFLQKTPVGSQGLGLDGGVRILTVPGFIPYRLASRQQITASFRMVIASDNEQIATVVKNPFIYMWTGKRKSKEDQEMSLTPGHCLAGKAYEMLPSHEPCIRLVVSELRRLLSRWY